jgi:PEGA domain
MDGRQEQLVAAAEAVRNWVHAQRAGWSDETPRMFAPAGGGAQSITLSTPVLALVPPASIEETMDSLADVGLEPEQVHAPGSNVWSDRIAPLFTRAGDVVRRSWRMAAIAVVLTAGVWAVRSYWSDVKPALTENLAAGRRAVASGSQALSNRVAADVAKATAGKPEVPVSTRGRLQVESNPAGARVLVDGHDRGVTPLTVDDLSAGTHKVVIRADGGSVQRTVSIGSTGTVQVNEAIFSGWLHVSSPIEIQLSEGNKAITLDDSNQALLSPGAHDVRIENRALGIHEMKHVDVRPGETTSLAFEPPPSHVSVQASEAATVVIDGEPAGDTPLVDYPIKIGTRDLTITSAAGDVRHQTVTVTTQPLRIDVDFTKH